MEVYKNKIKEIFCALRISYKHIKRISCKNYAHCDIFAECCISLQKFRVIKNFPTYYLQNKERKT
jgi:hypothetical protein